MQMTMGRVKTWRRLVAGLVILVLANNGVALAQEQNSGSQGSASPLVIFNVASLDRLLGDVRYLFVAAGQDQINEQIAAGIAGVNDLKGIDRTKPFGGMIFLAPGIPPRPVFVGYVPVSNIQELTQTIAGGDGPGQLKKIEGETDRYELVGREGNQQVILKAGYAFISAEAEALDRKFLDPVKLTSALSSSHDVAVSLRLDTVPVAVKNILLTTLRANFAATMQQRDDEPDGPYQLRKTSQGNTLEFMELLLTEGDRVTLGINASQESRAAVLELKLDTRKDGNWAKSLKEIGSKPSYFSSLVDETAPLSFSMSWAMDKREKGNLLEMLKVAEPQIAGQLTAVAPAVTSLFGALSKTAAGGHLDAFVQYRPTKSDENKNMVIIGGLKVANGQQLSAAIRTILIQLKSNPDVGDLEIDIDEHEGVSFHRFRGNRSAEAEAGGGRVLGAEPSVYIGTGPRAVWVSVGGTASLKAVKSSIDKLSGSGRKKRVVRGTRPVPFQFVLNMARWLDTMDPERPFAKLAREAFGGGADRLQVDIQPTDNGMRVRVNAQEGFLKLLGMAIGRGITARREAAENSPDDESP